MKHLYTKILAIGLPVLAVTAGATSAFATINNSGNTSTDFSVTTKDVIKLVLNATSQSVSVDAGQMSPAVDGTPEATTSSTVSVNDLAGYTLTAETTTNDNSLKSGSHSIPAGTALAPGTSAWGIRGVSFGTHTAGGHISTSTWSAVPAANATALTVVDSGTLTEAIKNEVTTVEYGTSLSSSQPAGTYSVTIRYTAAAKS